MKYTKKFNKEGNKVTITLKDDSVFWKLLPIIDDVMKTKTFTVISKHQVYEAIINHEEVDLDGCYLSGFSSDEFRNQYPNKKMIIHLKGAEQAFFENIDFSGARFIQGNINFSKAKFGEGDVNFSGVTFGKGCTFPKNWSRG